VDESKLKGERIKTLIEAHEDKDVFHHESDLYQKYQRAEHQHTMSTLQMQRESKEQELRRLQKAKEREFEDRMRYERELNIDKRSS
jgi:hypothetical protein